MIDANIFRQLLSLVKQFYNISFKASKTQKIQINKTRMKADSHS